MAAGATPLFHNQPGVRKVRIGSKTFMCMGAPPPFDHPHEFLDMGSDAEAICPYCSTLYVWDPSLAPSAADPAECTADPELVRGAA